MVAELSERLTGHKAEDVIFALEEHEKASPFFPAYADLMKYVQPRIERRLKLAHQNRFAGSSWVPHQQVKTTHGQRTLAPVDEEPIEVRKAACDTWREQIRPKLPEVADAAERQRAGTKHPEKVKPADKTKPWHDRKAMAASLKRCELAAARAHAEAAGSRELAEFEATQAEWIRRMES